MPQISWDGSFLGNLKEVKEINIVKLGRPLKVCQATIGNEKITCLVKSIDSFLPAIFDELKPIFSLPKIGTHTFRHDGRLLIAYQPYNKYPDITLDNASIILRRKVEDQVRRTLAFREIFGITDTHERSLVIRRFSHNNVKVISYLEPDSVVNHQDSLASILPQTLLDIWFSFDDPAKTLSYAITDLFCLNRDSPESSFAYYRPLIEEVIKRIDVGLITSLDLFFDRLGSYLPY